MADFSGIAATAVACLNELEAEYLRVGAERCKCLEEKTQLSAFLFLGIRCVSLLKAMLGLLRPDSLDAYDSVRRAFLESWMLQFEFRLADTNPKAGKWFLGDAGTWAADKKKLDQFFGENKQEQRGFGREYGELSEVSHPTFAACSNSVAIVSILRGMNENESLLHKSLSDLLLDYAGLLHRQIWLTLLRKEGLVEIGVGPDKLKTCSEFSETFMRVAAEEIEAQTRPS